MPVEGEKYFLVSTIKDNVKIISYLLKFSVFQINAIIKSEIMERRREREKDVILHKERMLGGEVEEEIYG